MLFAERNPMSTSLSDKASFVTGVALPVDGGYTVP